MDKRSRRNRVRGLLNEIALANQNETRVIYETRQSDALALKARLSRETGEASLVMQKV